MSAIQWTQETWNPIIGCTIASGGCKNCYAARDAARKALNPKMTQYQGLAAFGKNESAAWSGEIRQNSDKQIYKPLTVRAPTLYFVASMGDVFHPQVTLDTQRIIFDIIQKTPRHTYQILTKRPQNILPVMNKLGLDTMPDNVWLGTSIESQDDIDVETKEPVISRIGYLQRIPAKMRFISIEPMISQIRLSPDKLYGINWVIIGGESSVNSRARVFNLDAAEQLIKDIDNAAAIQNRKIAVFYKQMGVVNSINGLPIKITRKWTKDDLPPSDWPKWAIRREMPV